MNIPAADIQRIGLSREDVNSEVLALAHGAGPQVIRADESPFRIWNGIGWLMRRG